MKIGLNVGSGQRPFRSLPDFQWINIDKVSRPDQNHIPDMVCDGAHLAFDDDYADYFVLHHVMEHFGCGEADGLIDEAFRVLKPGGSLIVCVPDMQAVVQGWVTRKIGTQIFMTNVYGAYMGNDEDRHKWGYDACSLSATLSGMRGWSMVTSFDFRAIPGADIANDWWILGMECRK